MPYFILILFIIVTAVTTIIYAVCPFKQRYMILLGSSIIFYGIFSGIGAIFLIVTILTSYSAAIIIDKIPQHYSFEGLPKKERKQLKAKIKKKKRIILACYVLINIGILLTLKYFNFFASSSAWVLEGLGISVSAPVLRIALPLGISYYTLQSISYVVDVLRGKYQAENNLLKIALFISFFPQMHEGPFGRYDSLIPQMTSGEQIKIHNLYNGIGRMFWGVFKILMVANRAAIISDAVFKNHELYGGFTIVMGVIAFTIQLYAEFSGYIDVASGVAKIFGIELAHNFDLPFLALNVGDFWRRWHISLGSWFRDYIFYPISTSRVLMNVVKNMPTYLSNVVTITIPLFFVWFLTGLWHGASSKYIVYGLYYFVLMIIFNVTSPFVNKVMSKNNIDSQNRIIKGIRITKTLLLVGIGMLMFRAENLSVFREMIGSIMSKGESFYLLNVIEPKDFVILVLSFIVILFAAVMKLKGINIEHKFNNMSSFKKYWICFGVFCIVVIFGAYGLGYIPPDPIYGGF